jgi:transcriptional regulator with XRE-family HTH domain
MSIGGRLKEERERLGLNQANFAAIGEASKRSQIEWEKGTAYPNAAFLAAIAAAGADVGYILTGVRRVLSYPAQGLSAREAALLEHYRACTDTGKQAVEAAAAALGSVAGREGK